MGIIFNCLILWVTGLLLLDCKTKCSLNATKREPLELSSTLINYFESAMAQPQNETSELSATFTVTSLPENTHVMQNYSYVWFRENTTSREYLINFIDQKCTWDHVYNTTHLNASSEETNSALQKHTDSFLKADTTPDAIPSQILASGVKRRKRTTNILLKDLTSRISNNTIFAVSNTSPKNASVTSETSQRPTSSMTTSAEYNRTTEKTSISGKITTPNPSMITTSKTRRLAAAIELNTESSISRNISTSAAHEVSFNTSTNGTSATTMRANGFYGICHLPEQFACSCSPQCRNYDVCCADVYSEEELMTKSIGSQCVTLQTEARSGGGALFGIPYMEVYAVSACQGMNER